MDYFLYYSEILVYNVLQMVEVTALRLEIGRRICQYRKERGLSQKEFAELIGASNSRVSNWEQGRNGPDADMLADICRVLKVTPSELLDIHLSEDDVTHQEWKVLRAYRQKPELQQAVNILLGVSEQQEEPQSGESQ